MRTEFILTMFICIAILLLACVIPALEHSRQGDYYAEQELWDEAISEYTEAIELDPELAEAYVNRARAHINLGQHELAIVDCNKAIELDPELYTAYLSRGLCYEIQGNKNQALADYQRVVTLSQDAALIEKARQRLEALED